MSRKTTPSSPGVAATTKGLARHPRPLGGDPVRRLDKPVVSLSAMVLNNAGDALQIPQARRKPKWLRAQLPGGPGYHRLRSILSEHKLNTVCEEAGCPNMGECWARGVATIMILGDTCTRACGFCNVKTGKPPVYDIDEPRRVAESIRLMVYGSSGQNPLEQESAGQEPVVAQAFRPPLKQPTLRHLVITSVNRDELPDGGAALWAETVVRTRDACPDLSIEVLIPDFEGNWSALQLVIGARPEILNHNLETVPRMYPAVRPQAKFDRSVELLRRCKEAGLVTKTGIMVGIGERDDEVLDLMDDVHRRAATDILTIGQYLQPTPNHLPIARFVEPERFEMYREQGIARGFKVVESGPMVRSSYHADMQVDKLVGREKESYDQLQSLIRRQ